MLVKGEICEPEVTWKLQGRRTGEAFLGGRGRKGKETPDLIG